MRQGLLAALLLLSGRATASAEVILKAIRWHLPEAQGRSRSYHEADRWVQPPAARLQAKPRAVVTLANRGPKPEDGVLLRYAVSVRLAPVVARIREEGVWTVPFWVEERRVARLKGNQVRDIPIDSMLLPLYLKKMYRAGFWPDAIKIQVMVEPRGGEGLAQRVLDQTLPVIWEQP